MIQIDSLSYSYPPIHAGDPRIVALDEVSLRVESGECVAITGTNGSGKTTLCLAAAMLAPELTGGSIDAGSITLGERNIHQAKAGALADVIGLVMQDPSGQLFNPTVADEIAWGLESLGVPPDEMDARIEEALGLVGLRDLAWERDPRTLSGGEQKRLALAAALALRPQTLILDHPSGGMSPTARREMIAVLRHLRDQTRLAILLAESDPDVIVGLADRVVVLDAGRSIAQGTPREVYTGLQAPDVPIPAAMRFSRGAGLKIAAVDLETVIDQLPKKKSIEPQRRKGRKGIEDAVIEIEGLRFAYDPNRPVLRGVDLRIGRGEFVVLAGDNGAGKTTFARHLIGLARPSGGMVRILGRDTAAQAVGQIARLVGFAFQNPELQIFNATVRDEIAFGPRNLGSDQVDKTVSEAMERFGLSAVADQPPAALSFSVRRMVALASIAAMQTPILVLDEPTVGLDAGGQRRVMDWLHERHRAGATILLITHDMDIAAHAERVIVLDQGRITADAAPEVVFTQSEVLREAGLEAPFAVRLAEALGMPALIEALTPEGAADAWRGV